MRFSLLNLVLVLFISFCSCNTSATKPESADKAENSKEPLPEGWQTLKKEGYHLSHLSDWTVDESKRMGTDFILYAPQEEGTSVEFVANINLLTQEIPTKISLDEFAKLSKEQIANYVTDAEIVDEADTELNSHAFKMMIYKGRQGVNTLQFHQYYTKKNDKVYILTLTTLAENYKQFKDIGVQTMESITFD